MGGKKEKKWRNGKKMRLWLSTKRKKRPKWLWKRTHAPLPILSSSPQSPPPQSPNPKAPLFSATQQKSDESDSDDGWAQVHHSNIDVMVHGADHEQLKSP